MANTEKKYASLSTLAAFLDNIKTKFAALTHTHKLSDLTDYTVDSELSSTSTNPVQNKVLDAEFEAVSEAMNALDAAIDAKADSTHDHNDLYYTIAQIDGMELITTDDIDTICSGVTEEGLLSDDIDELIALLEEG